MIDMKNFGYATFLSAGSLGDSLSCINLNNFFELLPDFVSKVRDVARYGSQTCHIGNYSHLDDIYIQATIIIIIIRLLYSLF